MPLDQVKLEAKTYRVRGRVQGVGFRWFVENAAREIGVAGWVRNRSDGSVEVLAQGSREQLFSLRAKLHEGPRAARVDEVEEFESQPQADMKTFRIEGAW